MTTARTRSRTIIVTPGDEVLLGVIRAAYPMVKDHRLAQVCYRAGLRALSADPERVVEEAAREVADDDHGDAPAGLGQ